MNGYVFMLKVMCLVCRKSKSSPIVTVDLLQKVSRVVNYQPPIFLELGMIDKNGLTGI